MERKADFCVAEERNVGGREEACAPSLDPRTPSCSTSDRKQGEAGLKIRHDIGRESLTERNDSAGRGRVA